MAKDKHDLRAQLQYIQQGIARLEAVWERIREMVAEQEDRRSGTDAQSIAVQLGKIRETINQVEVKLDRIEKSVSNIESMRFRIRSEL